MTEIVKIKISKDLDSHGQVERMKDGLRRWLSWKSGYTQHEDLSLTTQTPTYKDLDAIAHVCYSRDMETETGDPGACWPASLTKLASPQFSKRSCLKC